MRTIPASRLSLLLVALLGIGLAAYGPEASNPNPTPAPPTLAAELTRTSHGIPHIKANDFRGLGYGIAYAYAQDNICAQDGDPATIKKGLATLARPPRLLL